MAKRKTHRSGGAGKRRMLLKGWWHGASAESKRRAAWLVVHLVLAGALAGGAYYGLTAATRYVRGLQRYRGPIELSLEIRYSPGDVVVANKDLPDNIRAGGRLVVKQAEPDGRLLVEQAGKSSWVNAADVDYEWLLRSPEVRDQMVREGLAAMGRPRTPADGRAWFDASLPGRLAERLGGFAYVSRVVQIDKRLSAEKEGPAPGYRRELVAAVQLRKPIAAIWQMTAQGWRFFVLDEKSVVLDEKSVVPEERTGEPLRLPRITNFDTALPTIRVGQPLGAKDIQAGLDLVVLLSAQPYFDQISEIDVSNYDRRNLMASELVLVVRPPEGQPSAAPQRIEWGLRIGSRDYHAEYNDTKAKVMILQGVWDTHHTLNLQHMRRGPYDLFRKPGVAFWYQAGESAGPDPVVHHGG